jgi:hypothetical protein
MKDFVLRNSLEDPVHIDEKEFERVTRNQYPYKQVYKGEVHYYATCPECENPIQLIGLYSSNRKYGAHTGKDIPGLNSFSYENYIYCPRSIKGHHIEKDKRKKIVTQKDINVYNTLRDNFDLAIAFVKKHLGYYISDSRAKELLDVYYNSEGWLYPHSTVNNTPFMLCYLQTAFNPYGLLIRKGSDLEKAILKVKDLKLESVIDKTDEKKGPQENKYYNRLLPNSDKYMSLSMMVYNHRFKENNEGILNESINIQISKDTSKSPDVKEWKTILDIKVNIPELEFIKFINSKPDYRNKKLQRYAYELMPVI